MNKKTILAVLMLGLVLVPVAQVSALSATNVNNNFSAADFMTVVVNVANFIIAFITILGIIFIVWGAIQYVTAAGDEGAMEKAKTTITYALIGLFIAALAYALEDLVVNALIG